jgi:hypothetical protein
LSGEAVEFQNSLELITEEVSSDDPVLNKVSCVQLKYPSLFANVYGSQDSDKTEWRLNDKTPLTDRRTF